MTNPLFVPEIKARKEGYAAIVYHGKNTRKCYWLCRKCLKGHEHRCSPKCPDYLSIARAKKQLERRGTHAYQVECRNGE